MAVRETSGRFRVVLRKPNQVEIVGVDTLHASRAQWQAAIDDFATDLQAAIAEMFGKQRVAGRWLRPNTPEYDARKRRQGYDPRRGHRTNALQRALESRRLYTISFSGNGRVFVTFLESRLQQRIPYAEYYADAKTLGGAILQASKRMVDQAAKGLKAYAVRMREAYAKKAAGMGAAAVNRAMAGRGGAALNKRVSALIADFERGVEFRRNAPFSPLVRPRHIKTTSGLTQKLMRSIKRHAERSGADMDKINRLLRGIG